MNAATSAVFDSSIITDDASILHPSADQIQAALSEGRVYAIVDRSQDKNLAISYVIEAREGYLRIYIISISSLPKIVLVCSWVMLAADSAYNILDCVIARHQGIMEVRQSTFDGAERVVIPVPGGPAYPMMVLWEAIKSQVPLDGMLRCGDYADGDFVESI